MIIIAETIRGINVQIGSDTTGLSKALKDVNEKARDIRSELRQVEKLLKFDPKNTELLAQKQKLLSDQVENTREKLNRLKVAQEQVNEQFRKGEISEAQYRAFQREIAKTENQLKHFESQLKSTTSTSEQFAQRMKEVGDRLKNVGDKMSSVGKSLSTKLTAPILGATTALVGIVKKTAEAGDEIQKMSQRTGLSATALSELKHAAELSGTSLDGIENSVKRMQKSILDLERGLSTQTEAFEMLGLTIEDVQGLSPEEQFNKITSALADVEDETRKAALAQQIFGRSGTDLLPMLSEGAEGLEKMRQEAHELGIVFDEEAANNAADFNDAITRLKGAFTGVFQELGKKLMPVFTNDLIPALKESLIPLTQSLADKISGLIEWFSNLSPRMQKIIIAVTGLAVVLGPVLMALGPIVTAIGTLTPMLGGLAGAIAGISAPTIGTVAAIAAFAAIAVEVYRNWEEVKNALISIWDLIKASAVQLGLNIAIAFEEMKATVLNAIDAMLDKLGVLEKLPFGIGDKFKGLKDNISDSADASAQKIAELKKAAEENGKRVSAAVEGTKVAFSDLGAAVKEDIQGVINAITGQTKTIEEEQKKQTDVTTEENQKRTDTTKENEQEQTETVSEEAQKRAELREEFEKSWNDKLFQLTASRLKQLDKEKEEALAKAEELGADKTAIVEYYAIKRQEILDEEAEKEREREQKRLDAIEKFEQEWANKLFESTATNLEILEKEKQEALAKAEELGANKADIIKYYAIKEQEILDEQAKKEEERQQKRLETIAEFEEQWTQKVFNQTASRLEQLEKEKQEALAKAEELGADKTKIIEYYANERQKILDEEAAKEKERQQEQLRLVESFEEKWSQKLFEQTATRLEKLEAEKQEALAKAEQLGADKTAIIQYYANEEQRIREEQRKKEEEARQKEIEAEERAAEEKNRIRTEFEQSWKDKLFELTATKEELLEREKQRALQRAEELGADKQAILEYYAQKEQELREEQTQKEEESANKLIVAFQKIGLSIEDAKSSFQNLHDSLVNGFTNAIVKGENFLDVLKNIADQIASMIISKTISEPLVNIILAGFGEAHTGALVAPEGLINDLPSYHSGGSIPGLRPDERIVKVQTGERILSRSQNEAFEAGEFGKTEIHNHFTINAVDAASFAQLVRRNPDAITSVIAEDYQRNGLTRRIIKGGS